MKMATAKPETKRQSPTPEPETEALRARKRLRQLEERKEALTSVHSQKLADIAGEMTAIRDDLSDEAREILVKLGNAIRALPIDTEAK